MASDLKLRGVGPFCYTHLEYETVLARSQAAEVWKALKIFSQLPAIGQ